MRQSVMLFVVVGMGSFLMMACAKPAAEAPLPQHPFPIWVSELEPGVSEVKGIRARFGEPNEIEYRGRGEKIWRFVFREVEWPDDDPMRPVVGADGAVGERPLSAMGRISKRHRGITAWIDENFFFPPRQDRRPRTRRLRATVHRLELVLGQDGKLRRFRYTPKPGFTRVAALP